MARIARVVLCLVLLAVLLCSTGARSSWAKPEQFERACHNSVLFFFDMLLICDGDWAWCWSGWNYSSDGGGMAYFHCGPFD